MPRPKELEPLLKVKTNLYARDYERLKILFPIAGPSRVIRRLVRAFVEKIEAQASSTLPESLELNLEDMEIAEDQV